MTKSRIVGMVCAALLVSVAAHAESLAGFGDDIPLSFAARQIVPETHTVTFGKGVDQQQLVSWRGGDSWRATLQSMAAKNGLIVAYAGNGVLISSVADYAAPAAAPAPARAVGNGGIVIVPYRAPEPVAPSQEPRVQAAAVAPAVAQPAAQAIDLSATPDVKVSSVQMWEVSKGETLRAVVGGWAAKAGWTLVWDSQYEYPIQAAASFRGDFIEASSDLIKSLAAARPAVSAAFYRGNRVIVISNDAADAVN